MLTPKEKKAAKRATYFGPEWGLVVKGKRVY